jgi:hypothetical protein
MSDACRAMSAERDSERLTADSLRHEEKMRNVRKHEKRLG